MDNTMNKKWINIFGGTLFCCLLQIALFAQPTSLHGTDFSVPESPAFVMLNDYPSAILRPGSFRALTVQLSDFSKSGGVLPQTFAVEFSPMMLINGVSLQLNEYQKAPYRYRAYLSAATRRINEATGRTQASIGFRFTLIDDSDPRLDQQYLKQLGDFLLDRIDAPDAPPDSSVTHPKI